MDEKSAASKPVVVAYDGSEDADRALRFGVDMARNQRLPLRVVIARGDAHKLSRWADEWTRGLAEEWAGSAGKILAGEGEGPVVEVVDGRAADVLVAESPNSEVLVIGAQGHGRSFAALNGSVSQIVVRQVADATSDRVVVGVDGSAPSLAALEFALHHAGQRGLRLEVFYVPEHWQPFAFEDPATQGPELMRDFRAEDERVLRSAAAVIARHPGVDGLVEQRDGSARTVLVDASRSARLVVVGSRGQGAFAGLLLGSVSAAVLHHAQCPVAVAR